MEIIVFVCCIAYFRNFIEFFPSSVWLCVYGPHFYIKKPSKITVIENIVKILWVSGRCVFKFTTLL